MQNKRVRWAFGSWAFLVLATTILISLLQSSKPPFELGIWYWHSPYRIPPDEAARLKALGIRKVFVRAGTFTSDGTNVVLVIPQAYDSKTDQDLHLVFNFDAGVIRHFESYDLERMSEQVAVRIDKQVESAKRVKGIQLDFDVPTRLLPRYAQLVKKVRAKLKNKDLKFSATGLMSWLGTDGVAKLSQELDFIVPQAYEGFTGKTLDDVRPVSDLPHFQRDVARAGNLRCPFYIGIPAYGHGLLYDDKGKLVSAYQNMSPVDAFKHPSFKFVKAEPAGKSGEEIIEFRAVLPAPDGRGLGYTLVYTVPSPTLLAQALKAAKDAQTHNCLGAIIYRYPEPNSVLTLPFQTLEEVLKGNAPKPNLKVSVESAQDSFDLIETKTKDAPQDIFLEIENTGDAPTFISPDAVVVEIDLDVTGVDEVRKRDVNAVQTGVRTADGSFKETRPAQARTIRITKAFLAPCEKAYIGPIRLFTSTSKKIDVRWIMRDSDGFRTYVGGPSAISLESHKK